MLINGDGISINYELEIKPDFKVRTIPALEWVQMSTGNYEAVDRGYEEDVYQTDIQIYGTRTKIETFVEEMEANRDSGLPPVFHLSDFNDTEKIFGCDLDYTDRIQCTVLEFKRIQQKTWRGFGLKVTLNALSVTFAGSSAMPALSLLSVGYKGDSNYAFNRIRKYDGSYAYIDHIRDIGLFTGRFLFTEAEAIGFRRYAATERGAVIPLYAIAGVTYPFGKKRGGTYPYPTRIISWKDVRMWGLHHWIFEITWAEIA
jgi:hypothetical protein